MLTGFVRRNAGKKLVAPIDDLESVSFTERINARGTWQLDVGYGHETCNVFETTTGPGIVLFWKGETILSGHATAIRRKNNETVTIIGIDDTGLLGDRIVEPDPLDANLATDTWEFDTRIGPVTTVLTGFIDVNMGPSAHPDRRVSGFTLAADPALGPTKTVKGRFQRLDDLVYDTATGHNIAFRAIQNTNNQIVGTFRQMARITGQVFSTAGFDVLDFEVSTKAAQATQIVAAGDGEGTGRLIVRSSSPMVGRFAGRRIEEFLDERSEDDLTALAERSDERLTESTESISLKVVIDGPDAFDYIVGDLAPVEIDGNRADIPVYETRTNVKPDSITRELTIGDRDGNDQTAGLARLTSRSSQRIRTIERI